MMRLQRDYEGYSGARLFPDEPTEPSASTNNEPARNEPQIAQVITAPPSPAPQPVLVTPLAANDDWSIPRPSRTGIAPAPVTMPPDHPRMFFQEADEGVSANAVRSVADLLAHAQRLVRSYRTGIAGALSELLQRFAR
jgi:hypothetical protein